MSVYLDVNVIVALFVLDPLNERAEKAMRGLHDSPAVSNLSAAEFSSVIARRVRTRDLRTEEARTAFSNFDIWCGRHARPIEISNDDISAAIHLLRRLDSALRTPDALHLTITQRAGCALLTFDKLLASIARTIGIEVIKG